LLDQTVPTSTEDRRRYLNSVAKAAERMDRLLSDLLELARLEARTDGLERERLDLAALARNCVERFAPAFAQKGLALHFGATPGAAWVQADGHRLEQVLDNLLGNALVHARGTDTDPERGQVDVNVFAGEGRVELVVEDDGPGIDSADLPHVFDRFFRGDRARSAPGSGLGLAIAREIVQRHGGTISAQQRTPRGVRFVVDLPAAI
jgi:signal transduction histidine kinase